MEIAVVGGDLRQCYLADTLINAGYTVKTFDLMCDDIAAGAVRKEKLSEAVKGCGAVVLPTPVSERWLSVAGMVKDNVILFGWNIPERFSFFKQFDFSKMDEVAQKNAVATAEGTLAETIKYSNRNISGSKCLITGYGKCAKEIALRFRLMGAYVTVAARSRQQRDEAVFNGMDVCNMFERKDYSEYDYIINTVPARIIKKEDIDKFNRQVVIIDIASIPGGTDFEYCTRQNIKAIHSLGLPGKYSPKTSGEILGNVIIEQLAGGI